MDPVEATRVFFRAGPQEGALGLAPTAARSSARGPRGCFAKGVVGARSTGSEKEGLSSWSIAGETYSRYG